MDGSNRDSHSMQAAGGDDETQAVEQGALAGWQFSSVSMSMAYRKDAHDGRRATPSGGRISNITAAPSRMADKAIPYSIPGSGTPMRPSIPPIAISIGKATGRSQYRRSTQLRTPQADCNHRQRMIQP